MHSGIDIGIWGAFCLKDRGRPLHRQIGHFGRSSPAQRLVEIRLSFVANALTADTQDIGALQLASLRTQYSIDDEVRLSLK